MGGTTSREGAGKNPDEEQQGRGEKKRYRVGGTDAVEQAREQTRDAERDAAAHQRTNGHQQNPLASHHGPDRASLRTESGADADFAGAALHFPGKQSIEANAGEQQAQSGEEAEEPRYEALVEEQAVDRIG